MVLRLDECASHGLKPSALGLKPQTRLMPRDTSLKGSTSQASQTLCFGASNPFALCAARAMPLNRTSESSASVDSCGRTVFLSSYTASLASFLVARNSGPPGFLSTTSFDDLRSSRFPVCVRAGSAPGALLTQYLGEGYPIVFQSEGSSIEEKYSLMADKLRRYAQACTRHHHCPPEPRLHLGLALHFASLDVACVRVSCV